MPTGRKDRTGLTFRRGPIRVAAAGANREDDPPRALFAAVAGTTEWGPARPAATACGVAPAGTAPSRTLANIAETVTATVATTRPRQRTRSLTESTTHPYTHNAGRAMPTDPITHGPVNNQMQSPRHNRGREGDLPNSNLPLTKPVPSRRCATQPGYPPTGATRLPRPVPLGGCRLALPVDLAHVHLRRWQARPPQEWPRSPALRGGLARWMVVTGATVQVRMRNGECDDFWGALARPRRSQKGLLFAGVSPRVHTSE